MIIDSLWRYFDREEIWKKWMLISQAFQSFGCWCCSVNIRQTLKNIHIFTASLILCSNAFWSLFVVYFHSLHRSFWYRALLFLRFHLKFASLSHSISLSIHNFIRCKKNWQLFCILCKNRWPVVSGWFLFSLGHSFHFFHMIFNEVVVCVVDAFSSFILVSAHTLKFYGINWLAIISASTFDFRFKHVHTWGPFLIIFFSLYFTSYRLFTRIRRMFHIQTLSHSHTHTHTFVVFPIPILPVTIYLFAAAAAAATATNRKRKSTAK